MKDAKQRKKAEDEEAKNWSRRFARNLPKEIADQPIGKAMALDEQQKQEDEEKEILGQFEALYDPAKASSNISRELQDATRDMVEAWKELKNIEFTEKRHAFQIFSRDNPDQQNESAEVGTIKARYMKLCETLNNYSGLFKFVPSGDKYISLLTGTIETIVQATVNHTKIGQGFADAIDRIGRELEYCSRSLSAVRNRDESHRDRVRTKVMGVFTLCFKFLAPYARWCKSRFERFKDSLNKNYYEDKVEGPLQALLARSNELERENQMQSREDVIELHGKFDDHTEWMKDFSKKLEDREEKRASAIVAGLASVRIEFSKALQELGEKANGQNELAAKKYLQEQAEEQRRKKANFHWRKALQGIETGAIPPPANSGTRRLRNWDDIEAASHFLETVADTGYPIDLRELQDFKIAPRAFHPLEHWMTTQESEWLWMRGTLTHSELSEVSTAAYYTVIVSERLKLPLVSYRFRADEYGLAESVDSALEGRSVEMDRFVLMAYSIIRQLVWLLPKEVETDVDLSSARFQRLDGSTESLLDAFNLIEALLSFMPQILIVVLDGFQFVDNDSGVYGDSTHGYLELFLEILRQAGTSRTLKVLITSDGRCRTLLEEDVIHLDEQVEVGQSGDGEEQIPELFDSWVEDLIDEGISITEP
ncbi:uncharacterized protein EI97DRAFT_432916 [Westerdykella ornata]|uniref:DUF7708 domain-containing protein n=1 Tax=Westerdykella ornata TaxID=318751 RepID=A0A6A6JJA1_WESOR|nr:uncharacterized protein EI97DRAFT_432916 [Westerdykella ornata]KAF2276671.1 hypothetical protein EI97DRAFT_432916 [Westerdykella ornata]